MPCRHARTRLSRPLHRACRHRANAAAGNHFPCPCPCCRMRHLPCFDMLHWVLLALAAVALIALLLVKGLYPGGGHDYFTHYFYYLQTTARSAPRSFPVHPRGRQPRSVAACPLFSPDTIGRSLGIRWTDGTTSLLTWLGPGVAPLDAACIADYRRAVQQSGAVQTFPYEAMKQVFVRLNATPHPWRTFRLPWRGG